MVLGWKPKGLIKSLLPVHVSVRPLRIIIETPPTITLIFSLKVWHPWGLNRHRTAFLITNRVFEKSRKNSWALTCSFQWASLEISKFWKFLFFDFFFFNSFCFNYLFVSVFLVTGWKPKGLIKSLLSVRASVHTSIRPSACACVMEFLGNRSNY